MISRSAPAVYSQVRGILNFSHPREYPSQNMVRQGIVAAVLAWSVCLCPTASLGQGGVVS